MIGALFTHYMVGGDAIPASVLLAFNALVLWLRRDRVGFGLTGTRPAAGSGVATPI